MSLTDEDKNWISAQIQALRGNLRGDVAEQIQAVRGDVTEQIQAVRGDVTAQIQAVRADVAEQIQAVRVDLEATETRLLRAFHDWASPVDMRVKSHSAVLRAMDVEIESLSDRVSKLEPPQ